jgi:hypothetical protein
MMYGNKEEDAPSGLTLERFVWRRKSVTSKGREKVFVKPNNVEFFSVHMVTQGGPMVPADPSCLRMNHYFGRRERKQRLMPDDDPNSHNQMKDTEPRDRFLERLKNRIQDPNKNVPVIVQ